MKCGRCLLAILKRAGTQTQDVMRSVIASKGIGLLQGAGKHFTRNAQKHTLIHTCRQACAARHRAERGE